VTKASAAMEFFQNCAASMYTHKVRKTVSVLNGEKYKIYVSEDENMYGIGQRRVHDNPESLDKLPRNSHFTFVITDSGQHRYGKVIDGWEVGVKHVNIAQGEDCCCAGELKISRRGHITFNLNSGTFTKELVETGRASMDDLARRTQDFFKTLTTKRITYTKDVILPARMPTIEELRKLRKLKHFARRNELLCTWIDEFVDCST
jgi:hypothetical protein